MTRPIIAIDPGASGGIAWIDQDGQINAAAMPEGMSAQIDFIRSIKCGPTTTAVIERVGTYMPGNSATAAVKFARHCGHIEAACYACGISATMVAPQTWMKALGALPSDKKERKAAIKEAMARRFPHLSVTLKTADALGILVWARERAST